MSQARRLGLGPARQGALAGTRLGRDRARRFPLASPTEHEHDRTVVFALCSALLLLLFDRGANLRHDIGAEPLRHREQSRRDLTRALDDERVGAEQLRCQSVRCARAPPTPQSRSSRPPSNRQACLGQMSSTMSAPPWRLQLGIRPFGALLHHGTR